MLADEFKSLQIGMYVTDVDSEENHGILVKEDFCVVIDKNMRMARMRLQPYGEEITKAYWIHYKDYDLKDKMSAEEFKEFTV